MVIFNHSFFILLVILFIQGCSHSKPKDKLSPTDKATQQNYKKLCDKNKVQACYKLIYFETERGNIDQARQILKKLCNKNKWKECSKSELKEKQRSTSKAKQKLCDKNDETACSTYTERMLTIGIRPKFFTR